MGLLRILRKLKRKEREMRILLLGLDNAGKTTVLKAINGEPIDEIEPTLGFNIVTLMFPRSLIEQSNDQSNNQSINHIIEKSNQQFINEQSNNQTNNQSINQTINQTDSQTHKQSDSQIVDQSTNQSTNQSNNQSINQSLNLSDYNAQDNQNNQSINQSINQTINQYRLNVWDVGGQKTIRAYWRNYYEQTDGLIFVIDSVDERRLGEVKGEIEQLLKQEKLAGASLLIFANKQDLKGALSHSQISKLLNLEQHLGSRHCQIVSCSAFSGKGLIEGMTWIVGDIASRIYMMD